MKVLINMLKNERTFKHVCSSTQNVDLHLQTHTHVHTHTMVRCAAQQLEAFRSDDVRMQLLLAPLPLKCMIRARLHATPCTSHVQFQTSHASLH